MTFTTVDVQLQTAPDCIQAQNKGLVFKTLSNKLNRRCNELRNRYTAIITNQNIHTVRGTTWPQYCLTTWHITAITEWMTRPFSHVTDTTWHVCVSMLNQSEGFAKLRRDTKYKIFIFCWPCISIWLLLTTNLAHFLWCTYLFHLCTYFEHHSVHHQEINCINTSSGMY